MHAHTQPSRQAKGFNLQKKEFPGTQGRMDPKPLFPPTNPQTLDSTLLYFSAIFNLFQFFGAFIVLLASCSCFPFFSVCLIFLEGAWHGLSLLKNLYCAAKQIYGLTIHIKTGSPRWPLSPIPMWGVKVELVKLAKREFKLFRWVYKRRKTLVGHL